MPTQPAPIFRNAAPQPAGLGGWLALLGFGLLITPIFYFASFPQFFEVFQPQNLQKLASSNAMIYPPSVATWLISETAFHLCILLVSCILLYMFFTKSPRFPLYLIGFLWFNVAYLSAELYFVTVIPRLAILEKDAVSDTVTSLASALIWSPYLLFSTRVRNTFAAHELDELYGMPL